MIISKIDEYSKNILDYVINYVSEKMYLPDKSLLFQKKNNSHISDTKNLIFFILRNNENFSYTLISKYFNMNHSTVLMNLRNNDFYIKCNYGYVFNYYINYADKFGFSDEYIYKYLIGTEPKE